MHEVPFGKDGDTRTPALRTSLLIVVVCVLPDVFSTGSAPSRRACPFVGVWTAGEGECGRDVTHLRAGCSALYALKFVHACPTQTTKHCES